MERAEDRYQRAEGRGQKAEVRGQKTETLCPSESDRVRLRHICEKVFASKGDLKLYK